MIKSLAFRVWKALPTTIAKLATKVRGCLEVSIHMQRKSEPHFDFHIWPDVKQIIDVLQTGCSQFRSFRCPATQVSWHGYATWTDAPWALPRRGKTFEARHGRSEVHLGHFCWDHIIRVSHIPCGKLTLAYKWQFSTAMLNYQGVIQNYSKPLGPLVLWVLL